MQELVIAEHSGDIRKLHEQEVRHLRGRILDVMPAATYQMDRFLSLVDIVLTNEVESAAILTGPQPVMLLNRQFVEVYCQRDEHLFMLVLHELYHVILGHSRLFLRATEAQNIVFDAIINALLCQQFREPIFIEFFQKINPPDQFPGCLLRPPEGWPDQLLLDGWKPKVKKVMKYLYGKRFNMATYQEIMDLLITQPGKKKKDSLLPINGQEANFTLLGDHSGQNRGSSTDDEAIADDLVTGILREVAGKWPVNRNNIKNPGSGFSIVDWLMPKQSTPRSEFLHALHQLLNRARIVPASPQTRYQWKMTNSTLVSQTVIFNPRDRLAEGKRELYEEIPLLFSTETPIRRQLLRPRDVVHIYVDVSGSMTNCLPWLSAALEPLLKQGACRLFAFSTVVDEIKRSKGFKSPFKNTGGTDIRCVYQHLLDFIPNQTPGKVVILTDGITGKPEHRSHADLRKRGCKMYVGLVGNYISQKYLQPFVEYIEKLPAIR